MNSSEIERLIIERISELLSFVKINNWQFLVEKKELIEASAFDPQSGKSTCLMRIEVRECSKAVEIPNIFLPSEMKGMGLGKRMIWLVFMVGNFYGYPVFLTLLTDSFKQRMLGRGALPTQKEDMLQIVKTTNLYSENDPNKDLYFKIRY